MSYATAFLLYKNDKKNFSFTSVKNAFIMSLQEDLAHVLQRLRACGDISAQTFQRWTTMAASGCADFVRVQGIAKIPCFMLTLSNNIFFNF